MALKMKNPEKIAAKLARKHAERERNKLREIARSTKSFIATELASFQPKRSFR
jgi:hypothetical protein